MATTGNADGATRAYRPIDMESEHDPETMSGFLPSPFAIVRHGMLSQDDAEKVWNETLEDWGMDESSEAERNKLNLYLTAVFIQSSSKDLENLETHWTMGRKTMYLKTLVENARKFVKSDNDSLLRMFVRSYNNGFFVVMQYSLLSDPANAEYRNMLASSIGQSPAHARFMFDTADFLPQTGVSLNTDELRLIASYKVMRTNRAVASANQVGEAAPRNDKTARAADYNVGASAGGYKQTALNPGSADVRAAMMSSGGLSGLSLK